MKHGEAASLFEKTARSTSSRKGKSAGPIMDGKTWLKYSISVWNDIRRTPEEARLNHPAMFPIMLPGRLIEIFSKPGSLVLDPFAGSGSTLIAAGERERRSTGIELNSDFIKLYEERIKNIPLFGSAKHRAEIYQDDAANLRDYITEESVALTVTSPPYWDILNQRHTADRKTVRNYGTSPEDLGNVRDYGSFLRSLKAIFEHVYWATAPDRYCCVVLMDLRKKDEYYPFHMDLTGFMRDIGFTLDDIVIWDRRQEYNNLRPLGYPTVFRINKVHEYILIFQKK